VVSCTLEALLTIEAGGPGDAVIDRESGGPGDATTALEMGVPTWRGPTDATKLPETGCGERLRCVPSSGRIARGGGAAGEWQRLRASGLRKGTAGEFSAEE